MSDPLPDPRIDVKSSDSDSSDEEEDDLFANIESEKKPKDSEERTERTQNSICCQTRTSNKSSKKSHKRTQRKGFVCTECQPLRYFKKAKVLERHIEMVHKKLSQSDSMCLWCAKPFYQKSHLLLHQKLYSHDKPLH